MSRFVRSQLYRSLFTTPSQKIKGARVKPQRPRQLQLEALEDRITPTNLFASVSGHVMDCTNPAAPTALGGVSVILTGTDVFGAGVTQTGATDSTGFYSFGIATPLPASNAAGYTISEIVPSGYTESTDTLGTIVGTGSVGTITGNPPPGHDQFSAVVLNPLDVGSNFNFCEVTTTPPPQQNQAVAAIGGIVYQDLNNNGVLDSGDRRLSGITVTLTDTNGNPVQQVNAQGVPQFANGSPVLIGPMVTGTDGSYLFGGIPAGTYKINETGADGFQDGSDNLGTLTSTGPSGVTSLAPGQVVSTDMFQVTVPSTPNTNVAGANYNFGEVLPVSLSGHVYLDGTTPVPPGFTVTPLSGQTVVLTGTNDQGSAVSMTTTTDAVGNYSFNNLLPDNGSGYSITEPAVDTFADGPDSVGVITNVVPASVGPSMFRGPVGQNPSPDTFSGITTTQGDVGIHYDFHELQGNVNPVVKASIGGHVYQDLNNNGMLDGSDRALAGITVTLTDSNGKLVQQTTTSSDGKGSYLFMGLSGGTYNVTETTADGFQDGSDNLGTLRGTDTNGGISLLPPGQVVATDIFQVTIPSTGFATVDGVNYNFGEVLPVSVSGHVFLDNPTPTALSGQTVVLTGTNDQGTPVSLTTTTNAAGNYSFTNLLPDNGTGYTVSEPSADTFRDGPDHPGTITNITPGLPNMNKGTVGTASGTDVISGILTTQGDVGVNYDFHELPPLVAPGTLAGQVTCLGTANHAGVAGVTVTLTGTVNGTAVTQSTTTDSNGNYSFANLAPGTYTLTETVPTGDLTGTLAVRGTLGGGTPTLTSVPSISLTAGAAGAGYDFTVDQPITLSGTVFNDGTDHNRIQDNGDLGLPNETVSLTGVNDLNQNVSVTAATDSHGNYTFRLDGSSNPLRPSLTGYTVSAATPSGLVVESPVAGNLGGIPSTPPAAESISAIVAPCMAAGVNYNFPFAPPLVVSGSLAGTVLICNTPDHVPHGESGVTVTLTNGHGLTESETTGTSGNFSFSNLAPGTYTVTETKPSGVFAGPATVGKVNGTTDGTATSFTIISGISLTSGASGSGYEFNNEAPVSISGIAFVDTDNDHDVRPDNSNEHGIAGVTVDLTGTDFVGHTVHLSTTTNAQGNYSFTNLAPSNDTGYTVDEVLPVPGFNNGPDLVGTVNGKPNGKNISGTSGVHEIVISCGDMGVNYNFVFFPKPQPTKGNLSGTVTICQGPNDTQEPLAGVDITLTNGAGTVSRTTHTDSHGNYSFSNLPAGVYKIVEKVPAGDLFDKAIPGSAGGKATSPTTIASITLGATQSGTGYDFQNDKPVTLSGTAFFDDNHNHKQDPGEKGVAGITVYMAGVDDLGKFVSITAVTDSNGHYSFTKEQDGTLLRESNANGYTIDASVPSNLLDLEEVIGKVDGVTRGHQDPGLNDEVKGIVLDCGDQGKDYNFTYAEKNPTGSLSGIVTSCEGPNQMNVPLAGVNLTLRDGAGNILSVVKSGANGSYSFKNLAPGTYSITITPAADHVSVSDTVGKVKGKVDGTAVSLREIYTITLGTGDTGTGYNFKEEKAVTLSGTAFVDTNKDGKYDSGDKPLAGVTVILTGTDDQGTHVSVTTVTNSQGDYTFTKEQNGFLLRPSNAQGYTVDEVIPTGFLDFKDLVGKVNGKTEGTLLAGTKDGVGHIVLECGENGVNYNFTFTEKTPPNGSHPNGSHNGSKPNGSKPNGSNPTGSHTGSNTTGSKTSTGSNHTGSHTGSKATTGSHNGSKTGGSTGSNHTGSTTGSKTTGSHNGSKTVSKTGSNSTGSTTTGSKATGSHNGSTTVSKTGSKATGSHNGSQTATKTGSSSAGTKTTGSKSGSKVVSKNGSKATGSQANQKTGSQKSGQKVASNGSHQTGGSNHNGNQGPQNNESNGQTHLTKSNCDLVFSQGHGHHG